MALAMQRKCGIAAAYPDGHEAQGVGGLTNPVKENGEVVVVVKGSNVHLPSTC